MEIYYSEIKPLRVELLITLNYLFGFTTEFQLLEDLTESDCSTYYLLDLLHSVQFLAKSTVYAY